MKLLHIVADLFKLAAHIPHSVFHVWKVILNTAEVIGQLFQRIFTVYSLFKI